MCKEEMEDEEKNGEKFAVHLGIICYVWILRTEAFVIENIREGNVLSPLSASTILNLHYTIKYNTNGISNI